MPVKNLTDRFVKTIKADGSKRLEFRDGKTPGLVLRVTPEGAKSKGVKSWAVLYRRDGDRKRRRYTIGTYPEYDLAAARREAKQINARVVRGEDPANKKREEKKADTFEELAHLYMVRHAKPNKRTWREDEKMLNKDLLPELGSMKASKISKRDIIRVVDIVAERGALIRANRVLTLARTVFNWACAEDLVDTNPTFGIRKRGAEISRDRVLDDEEVRAFWRGLEKAPITPTVVTILRLALVTGQRIGEIAGTRKCEIDLEHGEWEIPGSRTKNKRAHHVPLSDWALKLFTEAMEASGDSPFVFPGKGTDKAITAIAPSKALRRARPILDMDDIRVHDLRRSSASGMAKLRVGRVVLAKVLNHSGLGGGGVTGVYDRHDYHREKRRALQAWSDRLREIVHGEARGSNVVPMR